MQKVAIAGIGQTRVDEHWSRSIRHLAVEALLQAMDNASVHDPEALFVGNMLSGPLSEQEHLGALVADYTGLEGIEAVKVESACASGASAFRNALFAVASGQVRTAAVVGVEKLTEFSGRRSSNALATAADADYEMSVGLSFVAINALMMRRYMYEYGIDKNDFAVFPIQAHAHAVHNPNAMFRREISKKEYQQAKLIADPINLLDSSPIADGAAALVLTAADYEGLRKNNAVTIEACEVGTDAIALDNRQDPVYLKGVERSARKAFKTAGLEPDDIRLFEVHDAFSVITAMSLEASGFSETGRAVHEAQNGRFARTGRLPVATFGGLKGRGHPVGATGVYQLVEAVQQLRRESPDALQIDDPEYAMTQNIGGSGATVVTTILAAPKSL